MTHPKPNSLSDLAHDLLSAGYYQDLKHLLSDCTSILDLGCGSHSPVPRLMPKSSYTGLDVSTADIHLAKSNYPDGNYIVADVTKLSDLFAPKQFDCVVALDLIEHLTKKDGERLIRDMEKLASKKVIIFTPNGFLPQAPSPDNPWQEHLSGWSYEEMSSKGYRVIGMGGIRGIRGEAGFPLIKPHWLGRIISRVTQIWIRYQPANAYQILCIKYK